MPNSKGVGKGVDVAENKRPVGRPPLGKLYTNCNRRMDLGMDIDIRTIVKFMPEKYPNISQFIFRVLRDRILEDKRELFDRGLVDSPGMTEV